MPKKSQHPWFKDKKYIHFDMPLDLERAEKYVETFILNSTHSFYPFISYELTRRQVIRVPLSKREHLHQSLRFKPKARPIAYAAHRDSAIFNYYSFILNQYYEETLKDKGLSESITAFRNLKKNNIHFAKEVFEEISLHDSCCVITMDITSFFDNLNHNILKKKWQEILTEVILPKDHYQVFKAITKFSTIDKKQLYHALGISIYNTPKSLRRICDAKTFREKVKPLINNEINPKNRTKGVPQGSPMSAVLSNIYMLDFDEKAYQLMQGIGGSYFRYCDDMLFIMPNISSSKIYELEIRKYINNIKLDVNEDKTEVFYFEENKIQGQQKPLQYLGFIFDGKDILLRSSGIQKCYSKIRKSTNIAARTRSKRKKRDAHLLRDKIHKRKLYSKYSHLGNRNYISYALSASKIMNSEKINKQVKPIWKYLNRAIESKD